MEGSQHGVFYGKRLRSARKRERLQFDRGQIVACESAFFESDIVRQQERWTGSDMVDQKLGVEKFENRLCFRILLHKVDTGLCLCEFNVNTDARD